MDAKFGGIINGRKSKKIHLMIFEFSGIPSAYFKASFAFVLCRLRFFIGGTLFCFRLENRTCAILPTSYLKIIGISQFGICFFLKGMIHIIKYNLYLHWDFPVFSNTFQKLSHNDSF